MKKTETVQSGALAGISGLHHGFGTRLKPIPPILASEWERLKPRWRQVHGVAWSEVSGEGRECGEVDALFCSVPGQPIAVVTADCVPILLARNDGSAVAAVHAGWRGTRARILSRLWDAWAARGEDPSNWVAAIGPAIGPCCYEVSEELALEFQREFRWANKTPVVPRPRILDLPAANAQELDRVGVARVELMRACTRCSLAEGAQGRALFHSYRREGGGTRQYSMIAAAV